MASGLLFLLLLGIGGNMFSEAVSPIDHLIVCEDSMAELKCPQDQGIHVYYAVYGRHDTTTCSFGRPPSQLQNVTCFSFTKLITKNCNGKYNCRITASNSEFGDPCVGTYKYLDVAYSCMYPL
ncbi:L-rhamnose-binding lectin SML [Nothobranchius furzeri]|uniref:SUEL-type lectin domain-containing protein n=1 Tax=Nothobranchius furzeri TaxID=105023 RepID=A0A8C6LGC8_NOTFU|nr:L-rhamnose-binding lectin SML-like [Nothobranchius furzeri]